MHSVRSLRSAHRHVGAQISTRDSADCGEIRWGEKFQRITAVSLFVTFFVSVNKPVTFPFPIAGALRTSAMNRSFRVTYVKPPLLDGSQIWGTKAADTAIKYSRNLSCGVWESGLVIECDTTCAVYVGLVGVN